MKWLRAHKSENIIVLKTTLLLILFVVVVLSAQYFLRLRSEYYLQKAKNSNSYKESLLNLELAYLLGHNNEVLVELTNKLLEDKNYVLAEKYLRGNNSEIAKKGLIKAKYGLEKYVETENMASNYLNDNEISSIYIKSLLKQGKLSKIRELAGLSLEEEIRVLLDLVDGSDTRIGPTRRSMELKSAGYPQAAFRLLEEALASGALDRDGYFMLGNGYYEAGNKDTAYRAYQQALLKDRYYPQVYQQLVKTAQDLGRESEAEGYRKSLDTLSW